MALKLGVARKDITPQVGGNLYGYDPDLYSTTLHNPLDVTALVFTWDEKKAVIISATVCLINTQLADEIRTLIENRYFCRQCDHCCYPYPYRTQHSRFFWLG